MTLHELAAQKCQPLSGPSHRLNNARVDELLTHLPDWKHEGDNLVKCFEFKNYDQTMAFVNGVAWLAQRENHHPDLTVSYKRCQIALSTHDVGGLSMNDFVCAAKIEALRLI